MAFNIKNIPVQTVLKYTGYGIAAIMAGYSAIKEQKQSEEFENMKKQLSELSKLNGKES